MQVEGKGDYVCLVDSHPKFSHADRSLVETFATDVKMRSLRQGNGIPNVVVGQVQHDGNSKDKIETDATNFIEDSKADDSKPAKAKRS
jgi:hypothetical protein